MPFKYPIYLGLFFLCLPFIFILTKDWKYDTYIGELSYPIYISHIFVLTCMIILKIPTVFGLGFNLVIITVIFSILLNELVAKKIEKIRRNRLFLNGNK
jgi:peptidoglycan/LPS O-acetylase OafA/YrhL